MFCHAGVYIVEIYHMSGRLSNGMEQTACRAIQGVKWHFLDSQGNLLDVYNRGAHELIWGLISGLGEIIWELIHPHICLQKDVFNLRTFS